MCLLAEFSYMEQDMTFDRWILDVLKDVWILIFVLILITHVFNTNTNYYSTIRV